MATLARTPAKSGSRTSARNSHWLLRSILGLTILLLLTQAPAWAHHPENPGILILYDRQKEAPYAQLMKNEVVNELKQRVSSRFEVFTDTVAGWTGPGDESDKSISQVLKRRYSRMNIHLLIPVANSAVAFAQVHGHELFPEASVIFMAQSFGSKPDVPPMLDATGVILHFDPDASLQLALQQNPGTRQVFVVAGTSPEEKIELLATRDQFRRYEDSLQLHYVTDVSLAQLLKRLSKLPADAVVIVLNFNRDAEGDEFIGAQILPSISRACSRPIYVVYCPGVGAGALGGRVHDLGRIGRTLGGLAAEVLNGKRAGDIPIQEGRFQQTAFDWVQMRRWGITEKQLPAGAVILNRQLTTWERYRWWIMGIVLVLGIQAGLLSLLTVAHIRKIRAERQLARELELEGLLSELAVAFVNIPSGDVGAQIEHSCNRLFQFFQVDRIGVFEFSPDKEVLALLYSHRAAGVEAFPERVRADVLPWVQEQLLAGIPVVVSRLDQLSPEAAADREYMAQRGGRSIAMLPLTTGREISGVLVLTSIEQEVRWPERSVERLQTVSHIFANALDNKRAEDALRASEDLKARILDSLISHLVVISDTGRIVAVNKSWRDFWLANGGPADTEVGVDSNYLDVCQRAAELGCRDADRALAGVLSVLQGTAESFEMEYDCSSPNQQRTFIMIVVPLLHTGEGAVIRHRDITFRTQALGMLRESEQRFRLVADSAPVMIWMAGPDRLCNYFNKYWLDFRGRSIEQEWGDGWKDGIHPDDLDRCMRIYNESFDSQRPFTMEYRMRRGDGGFRWVLESGAPRILGNGVFAGFIGASVDITEQKDSDRARSQLSSLLISAQEQERASIARELHDHVNQRLALLAIELQQFESQAERLSEKQRDELAHLWDLTNDISHDVQALSHQLHSSQLQHLGLVAGIRSLCQEFSKGNGVEAECRCTGDIPRIDANVSLALFRVAQEALRNASKYSGARAVAAELHCRRDVLVLRVIDDGIGFDPTATNGGGLGLISMRERMRLIGGELSLHSSPGAGVCVEARVPLVHVVPEKFPPDTTIRVERRRRMRA